MVMWLVLENVTNKVLKKWPCKAIRNNIVAKQTTELVLLFHKKNKLVFLWTNMSQKSFKVVKIYSDL